MNKTQPERRWTAPVANRLATLERQLARFLTQTLPPATSAAQTKRRLTLRRRVIRDNLRRQRALRESGTEVGWRQVALTNNDEERAEQLARGEHDG